MIFAMNMDVVVVMEEEDLEVGLFWVVGILNLVEVLLVDLFIVIWYWIDYIVSFNNLLI